MGVSSNFCLYSFSRSGFGAPLILFFKVFAKMHSCGSRDIHTHSTPGGGGYWVETPPRNFLPSRTTYVPNFIKICPAVWISIENLNIHCPPGRLKSKNKKNMHLLKFNFREILFYKYCTILKKITPLQVPPLTPPTLDLGPKSK